jgi:hypothetical protein
MRARPNPHKISFAQLPLPELKSMKLSFKKVMSSKIVGGFH